jgi:hypothetical protein
MYLLIILFTASLSLGQDISSSQNNTTNPNAAIPNLVYIWAINGIENDQVIMALDQEGNDLFGQAKYEPENADPWNGVVTGLVSGDQVYLIITALKGTEQVSTFMEGSFEDESISGKFFQTGGLDISNRGEFSAIWINPDLSSYTPAKVKDIVTETPISNTNATLAQETYTETYTETYPQYPQKTVYHDVHQDADRILTGVGDISQIPIGMGGSGLP